MAIDALLYEPGPIAPLTLDGSDAPLARPALEALVGDLVASSAPLYATIADAIGRGRTLDPAAFSDETNDALVPLDEEIAASATFADELIDEQLWVNTDIAIGDLETFRGSLPDANHSGPDADTDTDIDLVGGGSTPGEEGEIPV